MSWASIASNKATPTFYVAKNWHSMLQGSSGCNLETAKERFNVKTKVPPIESPNTGIVLEGSASGVQKAIDFYENEVLGFEVSRQPLGITQLELNTEEIANMVSSSNHGWFMEKVHKYGCGIQFPKSAGLTFIQGRQEDMANLTMEFSKLLGRELYLTNYQSEQQPQLKLKRMTKEIQEVLFFNPFENDEPDFNRFIEILQSADTSLDICVFTITDNRIRNVLKHEHQSGTRVRIISDNTQTKMLGSDIGDLAQFGIPVKIDNDPNEESHMHHKFCVVDNKILMTGSVS